MNFPLLATLAPIFQECPFGKYEDEVSVSADGSRYGHPGCASGLLFLIGTLPREVASSETQQGDGLGFFLERRPPPLVVNVLHKGVPLCPSHGQA